MRPGRRPMFKYRISHFSGQGPYFLTISTDGSNNILKFFANRIFIYFLPKANVGTVYYKGEGGGFPQVLAVVSLVNPNLPVAYPRTKSAPTMH